MKQLLERIRAFVLASEVRIAGLVLTMAGATVLLLSSRNYSDPEFITGLLVEAHGMLMDVLVIGMFILWLNLLRDRRERAKRYHEEIDDYREWQSEEAAHRIAGGIRRLNQHGITKITLSRCYLRKADLRDARLEGSPMHRVDLGEARLRGSNLSDCNLDTAFLGHSDLRGTRFDNAHLIRVRFVAANANGASFQGANLTRADLRHGKFRSADFRNCDFSGTGFVGADLAGADLRNATHLDADALVQAKNLAYARLDPPVAERILQVNPALLIGYRSE